MIHLAASYSGSQIAVEMSDDPEEFAEFLAGMAEDTSDDVIVSTPEYLSRAQVERVATFLRSLLKAVEAA